MVEERPVLFDCGGEQMVGIASLPAQPAETGVLILVGGRQYRAGSHRQFVALARRLASADFPGFRFDFRGMGDSTGERRSFETVDEDIDAALTAFQQTCPELRRIVLWGLCDAASAALLYWQRRRDVRIGGLCLANPWMRSDTGLARTMVRHYYTARIVDPAFWRKLFQGGFHPVQALREFIRHWRTMMAEGQKPDYQTEMLAGLDSFAGPVLLLLSGNDLTAKEFLGALDATAENRLPLKSSVTRADIELADHTFSRSEWQDAAESAVIQWLGKIG